MIEIEGFPLVLQWVGKRSMLAPQVEPAQHQAAQECTAENRHKVAHVHRHDSQHAGDIVSDMNILGNLLLQLSGGTYSR